MCEYCGCRDIALIGRLSEEHYQAVDAMGALKRAIASGDAEAVSTANETLRRELIPHNMSEEAGLFHELIKDEYFAPTIETLLGQHRRFRELVDAVAAGDWGRIDEFEDLLREHIDREENGLFPATAVAVDGPTWEEIDRLTHEFNHEQHREHGHTEAESIALKRGDVAPEAPGSAEVPTPADAPRATADHVHEHAADAAGSSTDGADAVTIRRAEVSDADALVTLWRETGLAEDAGAAQVASELDALLALHPDLVLVAEADGRVVASVLGSFDGRRGWINRLATHPDHQGRGIAGRLLGQVEDAFRALGCTKVNLLIEADNFPVTEFYEPHGYTTDDLIFMEKFL